MPSAPASEVTDVTRSEGTDDRAVATASVTWALDGGNTWSYDTRFTLVRTDGEWLVDWTPSVVEPSLPGRRDPPRHPRARPSGARSSTARARSSRTRRAP